MSIYVLIDIIKTPPPVASGPFIKGNPKSRREVGRYT